MGSPIGKLHRTTKDKMSNILSPVSRIGLIHPFGFTKQIGTTRHSESKYKESVCVVEETAMSDPNGEGST